MFKAEASYNCSVLDYLNEDCWRLVLAYVPVLDIIRTERVSRRWQRAVLNYLQGVRFRITSVEEINGEKKKKYIESSGLRLLEYRLTTEYYSSFANWNNKLGSSVVATYCKDLESLEKIRTLCPKLEALTLLHMYDLPLSQNEHTPLNLKVDFQFLKHLCFYGSYILDTYFSQVIRDRALEELEFCSCYDITGQFLDTVNLSNLKSLVFDICYSLESQYIISSVSQLNELTKLVLNDVPSDICFKIQSVLDKMAKLEWLQINHTVGCIYSHTSITPPNLFYFEPVCQLGRLKYLSIGLVVTDNAVEAITHCCKELENLVFSNCKDLSSGVVEAICRNAGAKLTTLKLHAAYFLDDDDILACISGCPKLTCLSVSGTRKLTPALPARAAQVRHDLRLGQSLRLIVTDSNLSNTEMPDVYEDLILELD